VQAAVLLRLAGLLSLIVEGARKGNQHTDIRIFGGVTGVVEVAFDGARHGDRALVGVYSAITSLDGYVEDKQGEFDWAAPDDEVHAFVNDLERPIGTYLYGRRMYETMVFWETVSTSGDQPAVHGTSRRSGERPRRSCTPYTGSARQASGWGGGSPRGRR
jgi:hypothetical protein